MRTRRPLPVVDMSADIIHHPPGTGRPSFCHNVTPCVRRPHAHERPYTPPLIRNARPAGAIAPGRNGRLSYACEPLQSIRGSPDGCCSQPRILVAPHGTRIRIGPAFGRLVHLRKGVQEDKCVAEVVQEVEDFRVERRDELLKDLGVVVHEIASTFSCGAMCRLRWTFACPPR